MIYKVFNILLLFLVSSHTVWSANHQSFETEYIEVPLDHFEVTNPNTFKVRYLLNLDFFEEKGPIFAYTGGNYDITTIAENSGILLDLAPSFNAAVLFIEHRYYGESLPFGNESFSSPDKIKYLSTTQALADYAYIITSVSNSLLKQYKSNTSLPVIAFGGNYGGMLAAYLRMKFPFVALGAISSSPAMLRYPKLSKCNGFYKRVTSVYHEFGGQNCVDGIKLSWEVMREIMKTRVGLNFISYNWRLCKPIGGQEDARRLMEWITNILTSASLVNYHSPSNYIAPLPAYPVKAICEKITTSLFEDAKTFVEVLGSALEVFTNYTGQRKCNNIWSTDTEFNEIAFKYQSCTELITPRCSTSEDMFETQPWDIEEYLERCYKRFGIKAIREDWGTGMYGGKNLKSYSQLVITSNPRDPMSYETPDLKNSQYKKGLVTFHNFSDASSMMDLRERSPADHHDIAKTKSFYKYIIKKWLNNN